MNLLKTALFSTMLVAATAAQAQTVSGYADLHDFGGNTTVSGGTLGPDGANPQTSVVFDKFGNMYGTGQDGGAHGGAGMVWEITAAGVYKDLHDFGATVTNANGVSGPDGSMPGAGITVDANGNLFGTTYQGGPNLSAAAPTGAGNVWKITSAGVYKDLHDFGGTITNAGGQSGVDGIGSTTVITVDPNGDLFGTTALGGPTNDGMVWELTAAGVYKDLHDFGGNVPNVGGKTGLDGQVPASGVTFDTSGNMFGTTEYGGPSGQSFGAYSGAGIVWEITAGGAYKDVHDFGLTVLNSGGTSGPDGQSPFWGVTFDAAGNMYGTTQYGGSSSGTQNVGMVWEITKAGVYKDLHDFGGTVTLTDGTTGLDGEIPEGGVTIDALGNIYGTTTAGGPNDPLYGGDGILWELSSAGLYKDLHDFGGTITNAEGSSGSDGTYAGQITLDPAGNLCGTTYYGGPFSSGGIAWRLSLVTITVSGVSLSPSSVIGGNSSTGTVTLSQAAPSSGYAVPLSSSSTAAKVPASATVAAGATTATFTVTTTGVSAATTVTITAGTGSKTATLTVNAASLTGLTLSPTSIAGGSTATGTVTLSGAAAGSGVVVSLSSASTLAKVPASVTVAAGSSTANFAISTSGVSATTPVTVTASIGNTTQKATLTLTVPVLSHFTVSPTSVLGGATATGTASLNGNAGTKGAVVTLTSSSSVATLPKSVTIASGQSQATFAVKTTGVPAVKLVTLTAKSGTVSLTATLTVNPPTLSSVSVSPTTVLGGASATGTVTLSSVAGSGGVPVTLKSSSSPATVPATVSVGSGKSSATFTVKTVAVGTQTTATITAALGSVSKTATLTITAPSLKSLTVSPTSVKGGATATGTVTLTSAAPKGGLVITFKSSSTSITTTGSITVAAGSTSGKGTIKTVKVTSSVAGTLTATLGSVSKTATLTVH